VLCVVCCVLCAVCCVLCAVCCVLCAVCCVQVVSPRPDVFRVRLCPDDQFVILASDGLWDVYSDQDACDLVGHTPSFALCLYACVCRRVHSCLCV
jgi:hypothetical protein